MPWSKLPFNIVSEIANQYYHCVVHVDTSYRTHRTHMLINFTNVCSVWRSASLPYLYRVVKCTLKRIGNSYRNPPVWHQNFQTIISGKCMKYVKCIVIDSRSYVIDPERLLHFLVSSNINSDTFPTATTLTIIHYTERNRSEYITDSQNMDRISEYLASAFPQTTVVNYMSDSRDVVLRDAHPMNVLFESLDRLTHLRSKSVNTPDCIKMNVPLRSLWIGTTNAFESYSMQISPITSIADSLQFLVLRNVGVVHLLKLIGSTPRLIKEPSIFPNLKVLDAEFNSSLRLGVSTTEDNRTSICSIFPQLDHLVLQSNMAKISEVFYRIACPNVTLVRLKGLACIRDINLVKYQRITSLKINDRFTEDIPSAQLSNRVDRLFRDMRSLKDLSLKVELPIPITITSEISCQRLKDLELLCMVTPESIVKLLTSLPSLWRLNISWYEDKSNRGLMEIEMPKVVSPSLKLIEIPYIFEDLEDVPFAKLAQIVCRVPSLCEISAPRMLSNIIQLAIFRYEVFHGEGLRASCIPNINFSIAKQTTKIIYKEDFWEG